MGYASALGWVLFGVILVVTVVLFASSRRWVYYAAER
jgi:multiple sugar transport system permease protein